MTIIDAEKFLTYLIFSKHIDGLTCGEVKEAIEMCKVTEWIPVSERLPKDGEGHTFLVTDVNGNVVLTDFYLSSSSIGHPYWNGMKMMDVIAWMPLPEPYKADKAGEDKK